MADAPLTFTAVQAQIEQEEGLADRRMMFQTLETRFGTGDFERGLDLVARIGEVAAELDHAPELVLRAATLHDREVRDLPHSETNVPHHGTTGTPA